MQLTYAQQMITDIYKLLSHNDDYTYISNYMCNEEFIHDSFWPLHHKLCLVKGDLRNALNQFSETAEKAVDIITEIRNLIERDKKNKKGKRTLRLELEKEAPQELPLHNQQKRNN